MKKAAFRQGRLIILALALALGQACWRAQATQLYVSPSGAAIPPFSDWPSAATNIQDAIDASTDGDTVWVTNGVYSAGGRVMFGDLTNRVALNKAVTVQSVNGPGQTVIQGAGPPNGTAAVRCAWLTNGAVLTGFTITGGATRTSGDTTNLLSGGGVWCASANALVTNCVICTNAASTYGGGVFQGTLNNCLIVSNWASIFGCGEYMAILNNSFLSANGASSTGTAYGGVLRNCTITSNYQNGAVQAFLTNCIVFYNQNGNYVGSTLSYCCTTPLPSGAGNISSDPQLLPDGIHLASTSPCIAAGTNVAIGTDIDGQPWGNPPSIGCDDWQPQPVIIAQPRIQFAAGLAGFGINVLAAGQDPFSWYWTKDGIALQNNGHYSSANATGLVVDPLTAQDAGAYQVVVSNAFGMATSGVAQVVIHFVNAAGNNPAPPYSSWATAATNIQDAITAANAGEFVLVTNGVYGFGGKVMFGDLTNRVVLDKALAVRSLGGPFVTVIQGAGATNGSAAVRCAWLTNGALLRGFTLQGGATRSSGHAYALESGGGAWCASTNATIANCLIITNSAYFGGAAVYQGSVENSALIGNLGQQYGAAYNCALANCTLVSNSATVTGGGTYLGTATNTLIFFNKPSNVAGGTLSFCCTTPLPGGIGNISSDPQLLPDFPHLSSTSPCRGAGTNMVSATDLDGHAWNNPPSIGCEEWEPIPVIAVEPQVQWTTSPLGFTIGEFVSAQTPFTCYWFHNGALVTNDSTYSSAFTTNLVASGINFAEAGGYQVVVSNAFGMATSQVAQVVMHCVDAASPGPVAPFLGWTMAATNIQDAIDAANPGEIVVVTNGFYNHGGRAMYGDLTNRIALNKAIIVQGLGGPSKTIIQGAWDPVSTNGPAAVRCAWLTNGAVLSGFTLQGGATRAIFNDTSSSSGGGVWASSTNSALVQNCIIAGNSAYASGGGAFSGTLENCWIEFNTTFCAGTSGGGGGTFQANVINSVIAYNQAVTSSGLPAGGGGLGGSFTNCTIVNNTAGLIPGSSGAGGGIYAFSYSGVAAQNCIICSNFALGSSPNYYGGLLQYCDTTPLASGVGNITNEPQLIADGFHISATSPCRGAGTNIAIGTDIDGQPWNNPPSIGCDEWQPVPAIVQQPTEGVTAAPDTATMWVGLVGQPPYTCYWSKDGSPLSDSAHYSQSGTSNLVISGLGPADSGAYQVLVSNAFGSITSFVAQVTVHCVDANGSNPTSPFLSWQTAATNIQDAIDAASGGDVVLVTNGIYASGGKVMAGDLTNRVALTKALVVMSVNGPAATVLQGAWDAITTNGAGAVRCAWLTNGAVLGGLTLIGGATRTNGDVTTLQSGGGLWCVTPFSPATLSSIVPGSAVNCILASNSAAMTGGGACQGLFESCVFVGNSARLGGGADAATLYNCFVTGNFALSQGGGVSVGSIYNCTIISNSCAGNAGGIWSVAGAGAPRMVNSIIFFNSAATNANVVYSSGIGHFVPIIYCCTTPLPPGAGDISADPQLLDSFHIAATSPCRGAGSPLYTTGTDLDDEPWTNPPSIGCDEVWEANITGPLSVTAAAAWPAVAQGGSMPLFGHVSGRASRVGWDFGDGSMLTNASYLTLSHAWTNVGDYNVTFSAFNADNPSGVSTNFTVNVIPLVAPLVSAEGLSGSNFSLSFPGQPGITYVLEQTTNLAPPVLWQPVTNAFSTGSVMQVSDPQATNAMEFYRVRTQ